MIAKTDSAIRQVTPSGGNVFADLGFHKQDAEKFYADSLNEIENTLAIKQQLMEEITLWITQNQIKPAEVATVLHLSRPPVSDFRYHKSYKIHTASMLPMICLIWYIIR
uniref:helix-turn-helix domain-containing protein n=1 Tax=Salmonella enterica TaxID=28901 RepID=UPI00398C39AA